MNRNIPAYEFNHKNRYRQIMLERERTHSYWEILEEMKPKFLFIDLTEERFDMLQFGDSFVTMSDAFQGARFTRGVIAMNPSVQMEAGKLDGKEELTAEELSVKELSAEELSAEELIRFGQVIPRDSARCTELWQQACCNMVKETQRVCPDIRFVIIENYLCETVGNLESRKPFENIEYIRKTNSILRQYYSFLKEILPEAPVISPSKDDLYFTDEKYEYGAIPSHLNEIENQKIAKKIEKVL